MNKEIFNWLLFILLSFIWGSSFILMKEGMVALSDVQVAAIRILSAGLVLSPIAIRHIRHIPIKKIWLILLSGTIGSLLPAFLFCLAETTIDSALAGVLNALTPIFAIICGAMFFHSKIPASKMVGIIIGFAGSILLLLSKGTKDHQNFFYMGCIILATFMYGLNVNIVHRYLKDISSLTTASVALSLCAIPALIVLIFTGYFNLPLLQKDVLLSTGASSILGIGGTAIATVLFYVLLKRAGVIFASMVTYGIPFIAIFWGLTVHEDITWKQIGSLAVILAGVYIANRAPKMVVVAPE